MKKRELYKAVLLLALFGVWTLLVQTVDVRAVGETGKAVGLAALNGRFHRLCGVHPTLYNLTDWLGLVPLFVCVFFGCLGLKQLVQRRRLRNVDFDILLLGVYYGVVIIAYLAFEMYPVNYRPVFIDGRLEASYPSSTTLLALSVMPTLAFQAERRLRGGRAKVAIRLLSGAFSAFMTVGRALSGVHWLSDIVGTVLLSAGLFCIYKEAVKWSSAKNYRS